jgi:hypothetical protein
MVYLLNYKIIKARNMVLFLILSILVSFIFIPSYISTVIINENGRAYKNVYILNDVFKVLLKKAVEYDNEYILDEFETTSKLKVDKILKQRINNVGFFRNLTKVDKDKFEIISKKLMRSYFDEYVKYKFEIFYRRLSMPYLKKDIKDVEDCEVDIVRLYNYSIKDRIMYINSDLYSKVSNFFQEYNNYITKPRLNLLSIWNITIYSAVFIISIVFGLKRVLTCSSFIIFYMLLQILISPTTRFRFYFYCYITNYILVFYIIFHFINLLKKHKIFKRNVIVKP